MLNRNIKASVLSLVFIFGICNSALPDEDQIIVSRDDLICVGRNATKYLSIVGDPVLVFLDECAGDGPKDDAKAIADLMVALDPSLQRGPGGIQAVVSLRGSEITCISRQETIANIASSPETLDMSALLRTNCGP